MTETLHSYIHVKKELLAFGYVSYRVCAAAQVTTKHHSNQSDKRSRSTCVTCGFFTQSRDIYSRANCSCNPMISDFPFHVS